MRDSLRFDCETPRGHQASPTPRRPVGMLPALAGTLVLTCSLGVLTSCRAVKHASRVAVIDPTGGLVYWEIFNRSVAQYGADIQFSYAAPQSINDSPEQAKMVREAIEHKVNGIIIVPAHQLVLVSVLRTALRADIPVVIVGAPVAIAQNTRTTRIIVNDALIGRVAAERLIQLMHRTGSVGIIGSSPTLESSVTRERAFTERIQQEPRMSVAGVRYALSDWAQARQSALDLTSAAAPPVNGIFSVDEFCTHGMISAFDHQAGSRPFLVGVAEERDQLDALSSGRIDALITTDPGELAEKSVSALKQLLSGRPASMVEVTAHLLDADHAHDPSVREIRAYQ